MNASTKNDLPLFPIPTSGPPKIIPMSARTFLVGCTQLTKSEREQLEGFFDRMHGCASAFRFEFGTTNLPRCYFGSDALTVEQICPALFRSTFSI